MVFPVGSWLVRWLLPLVAEGGGSVATGNVEGRDGYGEGKG